MDHFDPEERKMTIRNDVPKMNDQQFVEHLERRVVALFSGNTLETDADRDLAVEYGESAKRIRQFAEAMYGPTPVDPHLYYDREMWRQEVAESNTVLGYEEWVSHRVESDTPPEE